jgi:serine/threonine protein kinase
LALASGTRLGVYEVTAQIGAGGMGEVYRGRDTRLDRTVAIKILPEALAADPQFRERFDREARTISRFSHPNICTLYDVGEHGGTAFLVMELLDGETLETRCARASAKGSGLPLDEALRIAIQMADALAAAHRQGIVHRDLKPGNIFLARGSGASAPAIAKLLDFGLARTAPALTVNRATMMPTTPPHAMTAQGTILGTFQYMAPEQVEGGEADARSDIFAFGSVLYEMLTGRKAFEGRRRRISWPRFSSATHRRSPTCSRSRPRSSTPSSASAWRKTRTTGGRPRPIWDRPCAGPRKGRTQPPRAQPQSSGRRQRERAALHGAPSWRRASLAYSRSA